jgi:hypothetical protein
VGEAVDVGEPGDRGDVRGRPGGDDDLPRAEHLLVDRQLARAEELAPAVDDGDIGQLGQDGLVLLVAQRLHQVLFTLHDAAEVELLHVQGEAGDAVIPRLVEHLGRVEQRLGRDAADVDAGSTQRQAAVDQRHGGAHLVGLGGRGHRGRTAPEDHQIEARHGLCSLRQAAAPKSAVSAACPSGGA